MSRTSDLNGGDRWLKGGLELDSNEAAIKRRPLRDAVEKKALESQERISKSLVPCSQPLLRRLKCLLAFFNHSSWQHFHKERHFTFFRCLRNLSLQRFLQSRLFFLSRLSVKEEVSQVRAEWLEAWLALIPGQAESKPIDCHLTRLAQLPCRTTRSRSLEARPLHVTVFAILLNGNVFQI